MFGVEVPDTGGRAGHGRGQAQARAQEFDGKALAKAVYDKLPGYAVPLFVRVVESSWRTPRRSRASKVELRKRLRRLRRATRRREIEDPLYVLAGREEGYVPFYDEYPDEVAAGKQAASSRFRRRKPALSDCASHAEFATRTVAWWACSRRSAAGRWPVIAR